MMHVFFQSVFIGLAIAAPVGPIGILCIRRTLAKGRIHGIMSGLGAATADGIYGMVAASGLTIISNMLIKEQSYILLFGGLLLLYIGIKTFLKLPHPENNSESNEADNKQITLINDYISTLFLTLTNPATIITFTGIFSSLGIAEKNSGFSEPIMVVAGVFFGSLIWWLFLSTFVDYFHKKVSSDVMKWINRISGVILSAFALLAIARFFQFI